MGNVKMQWLVAVLVVVALVVVALTLRGSGIPRPAEQTSPFRRPAPDPNVIISEAGRRVRDAIFDDARLERRLSIGFRRGPDFAIAPEEMERLRTIWRERRLVVDEIEPNIDACDVAETVATTFGLPGWR